jgi:S-adenosylmethionine uptake transporter
MVLFLTPASLIPALFVWTTPTLTQLAWMLAIGGCGSLGHICFTHAFAMAEATAILPFDFVRLPMMAVVGWVAFDQTLDIWSGVGAAVIIATTVYIAHREAVHQRRLTTPPPGPDPLSPAPAGEARAEPRQAD